MAVLYDFDHMYYLQHLVAAFLLQHRFWDSTFWRSRRRTRCQSHWLSFMYNTLGAAGVRQDLSDFCWPFVSV